MLDDVQCKSSRNVSRPRAAGFEFFCVISIALVCATLASPPIAYAYSGGESSAPWYKRISAKPQREIVGRASWYGPAVAGHKTATGERLDPNQLSRMQIAEEMRARLGFAFGPPAGCEGAEG